LKKSDILLDLFHDAKVIQVAHDVEKEEKEEIKQNTEIKKSKKLDVEKEDEEQLTIWTLAKYGLVGTGIAFLFYHLFLSKRRRKKQPDMQEMMMLMMYQTMMMQMQQMQEKYGNNGKLPPEIRTDDNTSFSTDWSDWYEKNKNKQFKKFGEGKNVTLNKLHVAENWKVRRDMNGKILDVNKTNEYIR
jgi:hypothetical protein